jgi:NADPH-dependent F420 reductase
MASHTVGIIGAGNMGRSLVNRLTAAGHTVRVFDHKPDHAVEVAREASSANVGDAREASVHEVLDSEVVILALWYPATVEFATEHTDALRGKIVVDISNPLDDTYTRVSVPSHTSGAELLAQAIPGSHIVKAFNTLPSPTLATATIDTTALDAFVASDHEQSKGVVLDLVEGTGLRGLDAGTLDNSRVLERLTAFGIELGQRYGLGFDFGIKYLPATDLTITR